jgi:DNA primase
MSQKTGWIDFKELRAKLRMPEVLEHYKVKLNVKGVRATGFCPLATHRGKRNSPSFSVDLDRGVWKCFGCGKQGNCFELALRLQGFNPDHRNELREGALKLRDVFFSKGLSQQSPKIVSKVVDKPTLTNQPMDFELQSLDATHPYLRERGFTEETIAHFGLGFTNRGMLKNRIAIPLHDPLGQLVGYAGRLTRDDQISEKNPKYLFPGNRERDGKVLQFRKSLLLYNAHQIVEPVDHLFVVEGFPAAWWLRQAKYCNVVALMGSSCSEEQGKLIVERVKPDGKVWLVPDGNEAGVRCAYDLFATVSPYRFVRWLRLAENEQPTDYPADDFAALMHP